MVNFCAVIGCSNRAGHGEKKSFYRIPTVTTTQGQKTQELSTQRRAGWIAALRRADLNTEKMSQYRVCSDHFCSGAPSKLYDNTNPDWVPTLKMGHDKFAQDAIIRGSDRHRRTKQRSARQQHQEAAATLLDLQNLLVTEWESVTRAEETTNTEACNTDQDLLSASMTRTREIGTQTELTHGMIDAMEQELQALRTENIALKEMVGDLTITPDTFKDKDDKVRYFTGLPNFVMLISVFNLISKGLTQTDHSSLNKFQQMMVVLMRLRLNLPLTLLSHWFRVSRTTISRVYGNVVDVMYAKLKCLIRWPDREDLRKTMPMVFREHFKSNVAVIIDCFEIFIERPSNLKARAMTWSTYKHNNTVKYLIGIIPQGVISYISSGWGGRVSDKYLTEHCNFLNKLLPGDVVLADRGFDIADSVGSVCAKLYIPAFTRGKPQLSAMEVETTRKIANVRIHVERVIGNLRQKYTFFDGTIPVEHLIAAPGDLPMLDKEVVICCALINLNDSVVPFD